MVFLHLLIIGILCFCFIRGYKSGLVLECSKFLGLVVGYGAAVCWLESCSPFFLNILPGFLLRFGRLLTFMSLFMGTFFLFWAVGIILKKILHLSLFGWFDRIAGGIFSSLTAVLIIAIVSLFIKYSPSNTKVKKIVASSPLLTPVVATTESLYDLFFLVKNDGVPIRDQCRTLFKKSEVIREMLPKIKNRIGK